MKSTLRVMWTLLFCGLCTTITSFHGVEGSVLSFQSNEKYSEVVPTTILRKRTKPSSYALPSQRFDEFGGQYLEEDDLFWNRILKESSFSVDRCNIGIDPDPSCSLASDPSMSCEEYMALVGSDSSKACVVPVVYDFFLSNEGDQDDRIAKIKIAVNGERPFTYIENSIPSENRTLKPGNHLTASRTVPYNFCNTFGEGIEFEVGVRCEKGEPQMFYPTLPFQITRDPPLCNAKADLSLALETPSARCTFRPYFFDLLFNGGTCQEGKNKKSSCKDVEHITEYSKVFITISGKRNRIYFSDYVSRGEIFSVGLGKKADSVLSVYIYSKSEGAIIQVIKFYASCSKSHLALNDVFGAITIVGFRNQKTNVVLRNHGPPQISVTYTLVNYEMHVIGVDNVTLSIDETNTIEQSFTRELKVSPHKSIKNSITLPLDEDRSCSEATAVLYYYKLPDNDSKTCTIKSTKTLRYLSMFDLSQQGKGKRKSRKSGSRCKGIQAGKGKKTFGKKKRSKSKRSKGKSNR